MLKKKIYQMLICLMVLISVYAVSLFLNSFQYYQWLFDKNVKLYSELGNFMINLSCSRAKIYSTDIPYNTIKIFSVDSIVQNYEHNDDYMQAIFTDFFEKTKVEFALKKGDYIIFQLKSNRDHSTGYIYCINENLPHELIIGEDCYILESLSTKGWYLYKT